MTDLELARSLRILRRTVDMLRTELRQGHVDEPLIADIDRLMEHGIASDPRGAVLRAPVDALRESIITPRPELLPDTVRACDKLKDAIEGVLARLG